MERIKVNDVTLNPTVDTSIDWADFIAEVDALLESEAPGWKEAMTKRGELIEEWWNEHHS